MTDQPPTDLRDRIAEALETAWQDHYEEGYGLPRDEMADAVLAVMAALTLRELEQLARPNTPPSRPERRCPAREPLNGAQCSKQAGHEVHSDRPGRIWYPAAGEAELATGRALTLTEAADEAERVAESLRAHHEFERSNGALDVMTELRRMAAEAQQQPDTETPCGPAPSQCDAESGEPCTNHEREAAHAEGEHCFCGPECGAASTP